MHFTSHKYKFLTWRGRCLGTLSREGFALGPLQVVHGWRNRRRGNRGHSAPRLLTGKYLLTYRENRGKEKRKMERKRRQMQKGKVENWKWKELKVKKWGDFLSFFFLFFLCCCFVFVWLSLFKTTEICFGSTKMGISTGKKHLTPGKIRKMTFPPQKNIPLTPLPSGAQIGGPGFHSWVLALRARCLSLQAIPKSWKPWINRSQNS